MTTNPTQRTHLDFASFCTAADDIDAESGNAMKALVADLLAEADADVAIVSRFVQGNIFPDYDNRKVKFGPALARGALAEASGRDSDDIEDLVADVGDMGDVCEHLDFDTEQGQQTFGSDDLTVAEVYHKLDDIATMSGSGSQARKVNAVADMLKRASSVEGKYIIRLVLSEMRIGVGQGTVRAAIAQAFDVPEDLVKRAIMVTNDTGQVAETARDDGADALAAEEITLGTPVEPMLAKKVDLDSVFDDAGDDRGRVAVDKKYDGYRIQAHVDGDNVTLFTRGLEDETDSLPDIVDLVRESVQADTAILDAEVVGYDPETGDTLPFNEITKRLGRKYDIEETAAEIETDLHVFDLLYADGEMLIDDPLVERHNRLEDVCPDLRTTQFLVDSVDDLENLRGKAVQSGDEGIMVKRPDSAYKPGNRGKRWLKYKADPETADCVVVGGEWGEGKRASFIGAYLLAVRDEDTGNLLPVGKVGTGLTDAQLADLTERFEPLITSEDGQDISFKPEVVFEVKFDELQPSPTYEAGVSLRFPRLVRVRDNKRVEDADTLTRLQDDIAE